MSRVDCRLRRCVSHQPTEEPRTLSQTPLDPAARAIVLEAFAIRDRLVSVARRVLRHRGDADETVDECLARVAQPGVASEIDNVAAWLHRAVIRLAIDRARAWVREQRRLRVHGLPAAALRPDDEFLRAELRERVWHALLDLPERQQEVLVLREMEGASYEEIGRLLGIDASTARVHAHHARDALRGRLAEWGPEGAR